MQQKGVDMLTSHGRFIFGGDWNPEQWDESVWERDIDMLKDAHINEATINVFSWAQLQPSLERYDFSVLDRIVSLLVSNDFNIILATSTAALPGWLVREYPDVLRMDADGVRHVFGGRHNFCPNSVVFRRLSSKLAGALAQRYSDVAGLRYWHVGNEYGGGGGMCYCPRCAERFRTWLRGKYGDLDSLNRAWCTHVWSHTIVDWADIVPPVTFGDGIGVEKAVISGLLLDYRRFQNQAQLDCFINERDAIRRFDRQTPITTNLMGTFKDLDYFSWGKQMDVVSWDNYPGMDTEPSYTAMCHDLMRSVGGGKPFLLMEQTPNQQNWFPYCAVKKPGEVRALSWQAVAHGADSVQFFQLRQSLGGCERFHGAVIGHDGTEKTRVFAETRRLGAELADIGAGISGSAVVSRVAIMFDWDSYWSLEGCVGPTQVFSYPREIHRFYKPLHAMNVSVDMIESTASLETMMKYSLVIAPTLIMVKAGVGERIGEYVSRGGRFVTGYMSGIHDENDLVIPGGYPGPLREVCGVWVEEMDALAPGTTVPVVFESGGKPRGGRIIADVMHLETAESLAAYAGDSFYSGTPAVSVNRHGDGFAYYVGTALDESGMNDVIVPILKDLGIPMIHTPEGVEVCRRWRGEGDCVEFLMNMTDREYAGDVRLAPYEVRVSPRREK